MAMAVQIEIDHVLKGRRLALSRRLSGRASMPCGTFGLNRDQFAHRIVPPHSAAAPLTGWRDCVA